MTDVLRVSREKVSEAISALRSVNSGRDHALRLPGTDDEPVYWQRKEWVDWAKIAGEELAADVALLNGEPSTASAQPAELISVPADAISLLKAWQTHLGSCRETCDEGGKRIWDRIEAVVGQAQPLGAQPAQAQSPDGGE